MTENITPRNARQGRNNLNVFYVLAGSLALAVFAYFVIELVWV